MRLTLRRLQLKNKLLTIQYNYKRRSVTGAIVASSVIASGTSVCQLLSIRYVENPALLSDVQSTESLSMLCNTDAVVTLQRVRVFVRFVPDHRAMCFQ